MSFLNNLEPKRVWTYFDKILTIPHASGNEEVLRNYVIQCANVEGLKYRIDGAGNVVVKKPASPGHESAPTVVLQSHLDMVTEKKSGSQHDFSKDGIIPVQHDGWIGALDTTLGADNGIGVAVMLAIMEDSDLVRGPLELLFTVDEERLLAGVNKLATDMLTGKILINTDVVDRDPGVMYVGCAAGAEITLSLPLIHAAAAVEDAYLDVAISGLPGGHSGIQIHKQSGNAIRMLSRILDTVKSETQFCLSRFEGGSGLNAIPREAHATVAVPSQNKDAFIQRVKTECDAIGKEYQRKLSMAIYESTVARLWNKKIADKVLQIVNILPDGALKYSYGENHRNVETSNNIGRVRIAGSYIEISMYARSCYSSALKALISQIESIATLARVYIQFGHSFPAWEPNSGGKLASIVAQAYEELVDIDHPPTLKVVHAGIECAIIGKKYPGMEMISVGPQIDGAHSPSERVNIHSVQIMYETILKTIRALAS